MTRTTRSELRRRWWAQRTPEQRRAHIEKCKAGYAIAIALRTSLRREWLKSIGEPPENEVRDAP